MITSHGLAERLILLLFILLAAGFAVFAYLDSGMRSRQLEHELTVAGQRSAALIVNSTDFAMLHDNRALLAHMLSDVGGQPGIEGVRIYGKRCEITASSDQAEVGQEVDLKSEACRGCHKDGGPPKRPHDSVLSRIFKQDGQRLLGIVRPIYNRPGCSDIPCHGSAEERPVLGLLEVRMSLARVDQAVAAGRRQSIILGTLITLLAAGLAGVFVHRIVHVPLLKFTQATRDVARGNLDVELPQEGSVELASLAQDFNHMAEALRRMHAENDRWSGTLERRVAEKTDELEQMYARMLQIERMASLGQLAATVAHELNNPLSGILTYAKLLLRRATKEHGAAPEELEFIADETQRCGQIVSDLLLFARRGIGEVSDHDLAALAQDALRVVEHHIELHRVTLTRNLEPVTVACDGAQIRQALVALLVNAVEAMPEGGDLDVGVRPDAAGAILVVADTGMGISPDDRPHIFEPFYTSKSGGKGVGLGLSVVYGIVSRHGGTINVESSPGKGTTFTIHLPPVPKVERAQEEDDHATT